MEKNIEEIIGKSIQFVEEKDYTSFDIYDALTNESLDKITKNNILLRRILIQLNARTIFNLRPLIGVKKMVHTKTISDFLSIYSKLYKLTNKELYKSKAEKMFNILMKRKIKVDEGFGWGLNFPYTTRFTNASSETPNLYNTLNSAHSILDFYEINSQFNIDEIIRNILDFILKYLGLVEENIYTAWLRYYPAQKGMPTPNVNATAAALFFRINSIFKVKYVDESIIIRLLNFLRKNQNNDGSWFYTITENGRWIDGFHTGFIIEALALIKFLDNGQKFPITEEMLIKGVNYYIKELFTDKYIPKFYNNKTYPIESQNCAQAIQTLAILLKFNIIDNYVLLENVILNIINILYDSRGFFYHKKTKLFTFKHIYFRWSQSPMILALLNAKIAMDQK